MWPSHPLKIFTLENISLGPLITYNAQNAQHNNKIDTEALILKKAKSLRQQYNKVECTDKLSYFPI